MGQPILTREPHHYIDVAGDWRPQLDYELSVDDQIAEGHGASRIHTDGFEHHIIGGVDP